MLKILQSVFGSLQNSCMSWIAKAGLWSLTKKIFCIAVAGVVCSTYYTSRPINFTQNLKGA